MNSLPSEVGSSANFIEALRHRARSASRINENKNERNVVVKGKDLNYLLYNWLEEIIYLLITEGFAIKRLKITLEKNEEYAISAQIFGESIDIKKHGFKVEIKSPTFHEMEIKQEKQVTMKFLMDL